MQNRNFCNFPLVREDYIPCPSGQICISFFCHQSYWFSWWLLFIDIARALIRFVASVRCLWQVLGARFHWKTECMLYIFVFHLQMTMAKRSVMYSSLCGEGIANTDVMSSVKVYTVYFSKAFDMVDRNILFYKMIKCGWHGKVIDTLRSLYTKTKFRVKHQGWLSHLVNNVLGVNQGGVASGLLCHKYMADLRSFLAPEYGIYIEENIIAHILWADDSVLLSDSEKGMQNQLDGLLKFCSLNLMSVNEIETMSMVIGNKGEARVYLTFNKKDIEQVNQYKCLGVIVRSISRNNEDMFACNYPYLCDQGRKALFGVLHRLRSITPIPPRVLFKLFDAVIKPILIYGSDVWGHNKSGTSMIDKVMLRFSRCVLNVKATTSNVMVYG